MKIFPCLAWWAPVAALALVVRGAAQENPSTGKVLILANDRALEGDIERLGDLYRIRRGMGEMAIAVNRTKRLCANWDEAVAFQRSQANLDDADERLRLARWCLSHGLKEIALVEARAALELRPGHAETKQLIAAVQRSPLAPSAPAPPPLPPRPVEPLPNLDLSADALTSFTTKVQPILMNACASCHAGGQGGGFQLLRPYEGGTRFTTQRNLTATVMQLKFDHLAASPLLVKAVSAHGSATSPPLKDRQSVPFRALQQWAENVVANNPHLVERRPTPSVAAMQPRSGSEIVAASNPGPRLLPSTPPPIVSQPAPRRDGDLVPSGFANAQQALASGQPPALPSGPRPSNAPAPTANPNDVVDPTPFNRRQ